MPRVRLRSGLQRFPERDTKITGRKHPARYASGESSPRHVQDQVPPGVDQPNHGVWIRRAPSSGMQCRPAATSDPEILNWSVCQ